MRMIACAATLTALCFVGNAVSHAQELFNDNFTSFKLGRKWEVPNYLNQTSNLCNNPTTTPCTFLGVPNVNLGIGYNGLRMTSAQSNLQETGIGTIQSFQLQNGTVEVDVLTGKASDPALTLPPGTNRSNIDGVIGVELFKQNHGRCDVRATVR